MSTFMIDDSMRYYPFIWLLSWSALALLGCTVVSPLLHTTPTSIAPATVPVILSTPTLQSVLVEPTMTPTVLVSLTPTPIPDTGWELLQPGLERRIIRLMDEGGRPLERLYLVRLEPDLYRVTIAYRPGEARSLAAWQAETGALLLVNGGFFTEEMLATGRIAVDGSTSGTSYVGFGGMLAITADFVEIRSLVEQPYDPQEPLQYALQSFPMLVKPGGKVGFPEEDGVPGRRTVVAIDENGRLLFILAPNGTFTLHELSRYLVESDLELEVAMNLDGGTSTGLRLANPPEEVPAFVPLPVIIAVYPRTSEQ